MCIFHEVIGIIFWHANVMQAAIAADSRRYNVFTFLEGEGVDDVIKSSDHTTPESDDVTSDANRPDSATNGDKVPSPEPVAAADDALANGPLTSSPAKSSEDVADLEFRGNADILIFFTCNALRNA